MHSSNLRLTFAKRAAAMLLVVCLLVTPAPAVPVTIFNIAAELGTKLTSNWRAGLPRLAVTSSTRREQNQTERNSRIRSIVIYPGDSQVRRGEPLMLAAVSFDKAGNPIGGVHYKWRTNYSAQDGQVSITDMGEFVSHVPGVFIVTAEGASRSGQVTVTVTKPVNSSPKHHPSPSIFLDDIYDWNSGNYKSATDPVNERGNPPDRIGAGGAGSGNFQFALPVLSLPGRGLNLDLNLVYNSRVWAKTKTNNVNEMVFDIDKGAPAVGWSFGFNKMINLGDAGAMIVDADGTRHAFAGTVSPGSGGTEKTFGGGTTDGTFIDYTCTTNNNGNGADLGTALYPNGVTIRYAGGPEPSGARVLYPTYIQDSNGNYQTITYHNHTNPQNFTRKQIKTITDTLGRVVIFHYDNNDLLTAITAAGVPDASGNPTARTLVRLHYKQLTLDYAFAPMNALVRTGAAPVWVVDAVYFPGTGSSYWFGDSDSYSSYGMIRKVEEQRGMGFSTSTPLTEQGVITPGVVTRRQLYNYPLVKGDNLADAPDYSTLTETWEGQTAGPAITEFDVHQEDSPRTVTVTRPDNTRQVDYAYNIPEGSPGHANDGLAYKQELYDANNQLLHKTVIGWDPNPVVNFASSPRPDYVEETDERGQILRKEFSYVGIYHYNAVREMREFGYDGNLVRKTVREYINIGGGANYNPRLANLIADEKIFASDGTTLVAHTAYRYDEDTGYTYSDCYADTGSLANTPGVVNHNSYYNPYVNFSCGIIRIFLIRDRGNLTSIVRYPDVNDENSAITETRRYDITGNLVSASTSCCEKTSIQYEQATQYAYPVSQTRGAADPNSLHRVTTSAVYDFNTGLTLFSKDANGRETRTDYSTASWRPELVTSPTGARLAFEYDDAALKITKTQRLSLNGPVAGQTITYFNGNGQVQQERALGATNTWDIIDNEYDIVGRLSRQSRPHRTGDVVQWTTTAYDALSRPIRTTAPDGSTAETYYNEFDFDSTDSYVPVRPNVASAVAGRTALMRDAWGRERWARSDALGRMVEIVEPNPLGSGSVAVGGLVTNYGYHLLGNLLTVNQTGQLRSFRYDSLGRLTRQKLAERSATLNDSGAYVGIGGAGAQWSDFFTYDERSNLTSHTDARGVKAIYSFNGDPLNRVQSVAWDLTGPHQELTASPIAPAATVTYQYRTKNSATDLIDITQLSSVTTNGISTESYGYDGEGRLNSRTLTINGRPPIELDYEYDALDRIKYVTYPKRELGVVGSPRKVVYQEYDVASRVSLLTLDGQTHASNLTYNAASQTKSLNVGVAGPNQITENYDFSAQTGLMSNQNIVRGNDTANPLLDLSYDYAGANGKRTGQLKKILNNRNHNKDRGYSYDALGRLIQATGGPSTSPLWTQTYGYDIYGNRTSVTASGSSARNRGTSPTNNDGSTVAQRERGSSPTVREDLVSEPRAVATGSNIQPSASPRDLLARNTLDPRGVVPTVKEGSQPLSDSPPTLYASALQSGPPTFADDPLNDPQNPEKTPIRAVHITELRGAIDALRARLGSAGFSWETSAVPGGSVTIDPIVEMRTALDQVLGPPPAPGYSAGLVQGQPILAIHIQELRDRVKNNWNSSLPIPRDGHASLSYEAASNRITTAGFAYDAAGNQTQAPGPDGSLYFQYDAANRLVKIRGDDTSTVVATYTYGNSRQRLVGDEEGNRTYYVCEGQSVIAEYVENGGSTTPQWFKTYVYLGARLLSTVQPAGGGSESVRHHHPDRLGTRVVTNPADGSYFEQVSLPFGTALAAESTDKTNRRFTSYDRSSVTKLDYAVNRYFDSQQGRFTQVDPIGMKAASLTDPQSFNMYSYCGNDPVNRVDPDGQFWGALFGFFASLFRALRPNTVNVSFRYGNLQPFGLSFSTNFRNIGASYGPIGIQVRGNGNWLPGLRSLVDPPSPFTAGCLSALKEIKQNTQAVVRGFENMDMLLRVTGNNRLDAAILGGIAINESGFGQYTTQRGGQGRGIIQIDLGQNPSLRNIVGDAEKSLAWAYGNLISNFNYFMDQGFGINASLGGAIRAHNRGQTGTLRILQKYGPSITGQQLNEGTAKSNYVTNVLGLAECFAASREAVLGSK